jgi:hypothetical protein
MKPLPIGISTLKTIINENMVYVDKTGNIEPLAKTPGRYFLSRPRRFGKSLLVDTLKQLFEGNEELFRGLAIHDRWDWTKKYPVVKIDFAGGFLQNEEDFENKLIPVLNRIAGEHALDLTNRGLPNRLAELIQELYTKTGSPVVVLVDEYDKPLLDNIEDPDKAVLLRDLLKEFYSPLKELDAYLQFVFLTGVSKFSKVSIFSGINNLKDISLDANYATICGYSQHDLETVFAEHLAGVDWEKLKRWYNGYNFLGDAVYNPFDILLFISENKLYRNFWFETGTPSFLVKLMQKNRYFLPDLENIELGEEQMGSFEIERIPPAVLFFQSGYLTIEKRFQRMGILNYRLRVPNQEVKIALSNALFTGYTDIFEQRLKYQTSAYDALLAGDMPGLEGAIRRLFAGVPWRNFTNNDIVDYEGYWASVLYAFFISITCEVVPEDTTNQGQADLTVKLEHMVCVMEIKVIEGDLPEGSSNSALEQIQSRRYAGKYRGNPGTRLFELGLVFSRGKRNLVQFDFAEVE